MLENLTKKNQLASTVENAFNLYPRMKGLLGRSDLDPNSTIWIKPCNSIHTWFMKFALDVVFVDKKLCVKRIVIGVKPWTLIGPVFGAHSVFEFKAGALDGMNLEKGDQLNVGR